MSEITELRALGFAESLPIQPRETDNVVARLESGRIGVAVEFCVDAGSRRYAVRALAPGVGPGGLPVVSDDWREIVQDVHRRAPPNDDD